MNNIINTFMFESNNKNKVADILNNIIKKNPYNLKEFLNILRYYFFFRVKD